MYILNVIVQHPRAHILTPHIASVVILLAPLTADAFWHRGAGSAGGLLFISEPAAPYPWPQAAPHPGPSPYLQQPLAVCRRGEARKMGSWGGGWNRPTFVLYLIKSPARCSTSTGSGTKKNLACTNVPRLHITNKRKRAPTQESVLLTQYQRWYLVRGMRILLRHAEALVVAHESHNRVGREL